jgi:hypothetical protein
MGWISSTTRRVLPFGIPLKAEFPPVQLVDARPTQEMTLRELEERTRRLQKLENLYHKGQRLAWDGKQVLAELVEKHGGVIDLPREKREALANIFTIIMWGELGAWEVASYLAEHIRDHTEAKMAATIQTFDEARHYYVLRDYLQMLDVPLPQPNSFVKSMLAQLLATDSVLYKLIGMQLFVEHVAIHLFRALSEARVEPVLADLLYYFQRDEARHIGLGKLYLPELLPRLSRREALQAQIYQLWLVTFMQMSIEFHRKDAELLGLDIHEAMMKALRDQGEMLDEIKGAKGVRGVVVMPRRLRFVNKFLLDQLWSQQRGANLGLSNPVMKRARTHFVNVAERVWGAVA